MHKMEYIDDFMASYNFHNVYAEIRYYEECKQGATDNDVQHVMF